MTQENGNGNGHNRNRPRPEFPPLRTFVVTRVNFKQTAEVLTFVDAATAKDLSAEDLSKCSVSRVPPFLEETVEAHRYYTDNAGSLCFSQHVWDTFMKQPTERMPICMAAGTWKDVVEITKHLEVRPAGQLN
jgi:hypothetical protein